MYIVIISDKCINYYFAHAHSPSTMTTADVFNLKKKNYLENLTLLLRSLTYACSYWGHNFCAVDKQVL